MGASCLPLTRDRFVLAVTFRSCADRFCALRSSTTPWLRVLSPGLVTEALLHGEQGSLLLIAAEAYGADEWHLFDESVVAIPEP